MSTRTQGILDRVSDAPKFSGVRWILGDGVITNYMQSFVDDTMKRNAEFQSKAGVQPKIVRKSPTKCCPWCDALVGEYKYPDEVPKDVYRRHDNCNCIVEFYPGDGKKQNVWSKQWQEAPKEVIEERKAFGILPKDKEAAKQLLKDIGFDAVSPSVDNVNATALKASAAQLEKLERRFGAIKDSTNTVVSQSGSKKHAMAWVDYNRNNPTDQQLTFGGIYRNDKRLVSRTGELVDDFWFMPAEMSDETLRIYPITHEYGHMLENVLAARDKANAPYGLGDVGYYSRAYREEIIKIAEERNPNFSLKDNISIYGRKSNMEFFAEVFANSQLGAPNELGDAMNIWLERKGV